jgi:hypothetical protein
MTDYLFKSGIKIHIPNDLVNWFDAWTEAKVQMSILLHLPAVEQKERKPYTFSEKGRKKIIEKRSTKGERRKQW